MAKGHWCTALEAEAECEVGAVSGVEFRYAGYLMDAVEVAQVAQVDASGAGVVGDRSICRMDRSGLMN